MSHLLHKLHTDLDSDRSLPLISPPHPRCQSPGLTSRCNTVDLYSIQSIGHIHVQRSGALRLTKYSACAALLRLRIWKRNCLHLSFSSAISFWLCSICLHQLPPYTQSIPQDFKFENEGPVHELRQSFSSPLQAEGLFSPIHPLPSLFPASASETQPRGSP